ncbi:Ribonuclease H-like superfamily [Sesbania bispinosa]|nr:Ribonuclease H-like superfamily [Sesbania bispinosa]
MATNVQAQPNNPTQHARGVSSHWKIPPPSAIKCNSDAAWSKSRPVGAVVVIARDCCGKLLSSLAKKIQAPNPLIAEALAMREAITAAYNFNWSKVVFESDCQILVEACRRERSVAQIKLIVEDILTVASGFTHCGFTWVQRQGNSVAHKVAKECLSGSLSSFWMASAPSWLQHQLAQDLSLALQSSRHQSHQSFCDQNREESNDRSFAALHSED